MFEILLYSSAFLNVCADKKINEGKKPPETTTGKREWHLIQSKIR